MPCRRQMTWHPPRHRIQTQGRPVVKLYVDIDRCTRIHDYKFYCLWSDLIEKSFLDLPHTQQTHTPVMLLWWQSIRSSVESVPFTPSLEPGANKLSTAVAAFEKSHWHFIIMEEKKTSLVNLAKFFQIYRVFVLRNLLCTEMKNICKLNKSCETRLPKHLKYTIVCPPAIAIQYNRWYYILCEINVYYSIMWINSLHLSNFD